MVLVFLIMVFLFIDTRIDNAIDTERKHKDAIRNGDNFYYDSNNRTRITKTNNYGGMILRPASNNPIDRLNDELNYIENNDRILMDFKTGQVLKNYSKEWRIKLINEWIQIYKEEKSRVSTMQYPPDNETEDYRNSLCKGKRYFDIQTHDIYTVRNFGINHMYFMRVSDGKFIRPIDKIDYNIDTRWQKCEPNKEQQREIDKLNEEQDTIRRTYSGLEMYNKLYRNDKIYYGRLYK